MWGTNTEKWVGFVATQVGVRMGEEFLLLPQRTETYQRTDSKGEASSSVFPILCYLQDMEQVKYGMALPYIKLT